ncbi:MAG: HK97 gp10 family phage protein [Oscillospiraceae bacterium]
MGKWGSADFEQLKKLQKNIEKLQKVDMDKFYIDCAKELAARLLSLVIPNTKVGDYPGLTGKNGGTLQRGWTARGEKEAAAGNVPKAKDYVASLPVVKDGNTYRVTVYNPVSYASYVEFGHRTANHKGWVDARYMLTVSEEILKTKIPGVLERRLAALLKGALDV